MDNYKPSVVVLGGGLTPLGVARDLTQHGIDVYSLNDKTNSATASKYFKKCFIKPDLNDNLENIKKSLIKIKNFIGRPIVVYPTSDLDAVSLSLLVDELPADDYHFVVGPKEAVDILVHKDKFYKLLNECEIERPCTVFPEFTEDILKNKHRMRYPILVKPFVTQLFKRKLKTNVKAFLSHSPQQAEQYYSFAQKNDVGILLQEVLLGSSKNSYQLEGYYSKDYEPICLFARKRERIWPPDFGNTTLCSSVPLSELEEQIEVINYLVKKINYYGLLSAEFIQDERDGKLKLLEINARPWWHCWLSTACGVDILYFSYLDAIGENPLIFADTNYDIGVKSIYWGLDVKSAGYAYLNKQLGLSEWLKSLSPPRNFCFFHTEDILPFVLDTKVIISRYIKDKINKRKRCG
jgi:D-aspartate ligase